LNLLLSPGSHAVELRSGPRQRTIAVTLAAGARVSHFVDLSGGGRTGRIEVRSEPAGAEVSVDGKVHGRTPLVIGNVPPAQHSVRLAGEQGAREQTVTLEPRGTASVLAPLSGLQPVSGWVSFASPEELKIFENGVFLGTTARARIPLRTGRHTLQFVNEALGFRAVRAVDVRGGRVQQIPVALPMGTLDVNATPWAEVWVDGRRIGETPIGNLSLRIGRHHVTFKHPELGEQQRDATITLAGPTRLSVNLSQ
jgi:hypothetical protein